MITMLGFLVFDCAADANWGAIDIETASNPAFFKKHLRSMA